MIIRQTRSTGWADYLYASWPDWRTPHMLPRNKRIAKLDTTQPIQTSTLKRMERKQNCFYKTDEKIRTTSSVCRCVSVFIKMRLR